MRTLVISGISGSGKTTFLRALEDIGFFCVDNFPIILLESFLDLCERMESKIEDSAFVIDVREREFLRKGPEVIKEIKKKREIEVIFLESSDETIVKRFRETRRAHPFYEMPNIREAIRLERELTRSLKEMADRLIDTTYLTPHELRKFVFENYGGKEKGMKVNLISFGYAHGLPFEADLIFDVRFLSNPYFVNELKEKTGLSEEVERFIESKEEFQMFFKLATEFLSFLLPLYEKEGKRYLNIGIGCSGGKHRSPFVVKRLAQELKARGYNISTQFRDMEKS